MKEKRGNTPFVDKITPSLPAQCFSFDTNCSEASSPETQHQKTPRWQKWRIILLSLKRSQIWKAASSVLQRFIKSLKPWLSSNRSHSRRNTNSRIARKRCSPNGRRSSQMIRALLGRRERTRRKKRQRKRCLRQRTERWSQRKKKGSWRRRKRRSRRRRRGM